MKSLVPVVEAAEDGDGGLQTGGSAAHLVKISIQTSDSRLLQPRVQRLTPVNTSQAPERTGGNTNVKTLAFLAVT